MRVIPAVQKLYDTLAGDERVGAAIILRSLEEPIRNIAANSGHDGGVIAEEVKSREGSIGFDANTGEFVDMFKKGIVDPTKVVKNALLNAASIAGLMLTTQVLVTRSDETDGGAKPKVEGSIR